MNDELRELYQEIILEHGRHPRHRGLPESPTHRAEGFNPLCGDRVEFGLRLEGGTLSAVGFEGSGCAISQASASVMAEAVAGHSEQEARELAARFRRLVRGEEEADLETLGDLAAFAGVAQFPMRVKCATLAWHTLIAALDGRAEADVQEEAP